MDRNLSKLQERIDNRGAWHAAVHGIAKSETQLGNKQHRIEENGFLFLLFALFLYLLFFFSFFSHFLTTEKSENKTIDLVLESDEIE